MSPYENTSILMYEHSAQLKIFLEHNYAQEWIEVLNEELPLIYTPGQLELPISQTTQYCDFSGEKYEDHMKPRNQKMIYTYSQWKLQYVQIPKCASSTHVTI